MKQNNTWKYVSLVLIIILVGTNIIWFLAGFGEDLHSKENYLLKTLMKADAEVSKVSLDSQRAESYYDEASYAYENGEYNLVESNCRLARDSYSEESQGYKRIRAELISTEIEDKLIDIYVETLEIDSEISLNMFEACEHFEVAARHYNRYMTDLTTGDDVWEMGNDAIESMNEKIRDHDDNVRDYNDKLEEYRIELKLRIENDFAK